MPSLPDLPVEILSCIAQPLIGARVGFQDNGICSLRLTCRAVCLKTQYDFGTAAFSTLRLDLHPKTLQHLLLVLKQPAFGGLVKKVVFAHWGDEYVSFPFIEQDEEVDENLSLEEQIRFVLRSIFADAFKGMLNLREIVIITPFIARFQQQECFFDAKESWDVNENAQTTFEANKEGTKVFKVNQNCITNDSLYALIAEAAAKNNSRFTSLEHDNAQPQHGRWISHAVAHSVLYGTFADSVPALRHIQKLKINLSFRQFSWPDTTADRNQVSKHEPFGTLLNAMPQLASLDLKFDGYYKQQQDVTLILEAMSTADQIHLPSLTSLTLRNTLAKAPVLAALLRNHKDTLKHLALRFVEVEAPGTWRLVLSVLLHEMPALQELHLVGMRQGDEDFESVKKCGGFNWIGRDEVMQGLTSLLGKFDLFNVR